MPANESHRSTCEIFSVSPSVCIHIRDDIVLEGIYARGLYPRGASFLRTSSASGAKRLVDLSYGWMARAVWDRILLEEEGRRRSTRGWDFISLFTYLIPDLLPPQENHSLFPCTGRVIGSSWSKMAKWSAIGVPSRRFIDSMRHITRGRWVIRSLAFDVILRQW